MELTSFLKNESLTTSISHIQIQAAVPKTQKLQMQSLSSSTLSPGADATQLMKCVATRGVRFFCVTLLTVQAIVKVRLKISYTAGQGFVSDVADVKFPDHLLS